MVELGLDRLPGPDPESGRAPLLDLGMRLGEASGALAALPILRLAVDSVTRVATFDEWGIT